MRSLPLIFMFSLCLMLFSSQAEVHYICGGCNDALQTTIKNANRGDTIIIHKGLFTNPRLIIDKPLYIVGKNYPVFDAMHEGTLITIKSDSVSITGVEFANTGYSHLEEYSGVRIENANYVNIKYNRFYDTFFAVYISNSKHTLIEGNVIYGKAVTESTSGNGIHCWKSDSLEIRKNFIAGHRDGIYLEFVSNSLIQNNKSQGNLRYGLHFMFSPGNAYRYNTFTSNGAGVAVMYTKDVEMTGNTFNANWGSSSYGLLLKDISDSKISDNVFSKNTVGIYMEGCERINLKRNNFYMNGWALKLLGNCYDDTLIANNFIGNSFDLLTNSTSSSNYLSANYWDRYEGYDLNRDKIGDVSYRPVSLFSIMIENVPESGILLRSFMVTLLDKLERVFPSLIPDRLMDESPLMKQV